MILPNMEQWMISTLHDVKNIISDLSEHRAHPAMIGGVAGCMYYFGTFKVA